MSTFLVELDRRRRKLQQAFPYWVIWYWAKSSLDDVTWHARLLPEMRAGSPDELEKLLRVWEGEP